MVSLTCERKRAHQHGIPQAAMKFSGNCMDIDETCKSKTYQYFIHFKKHRKTVVTLYEMSTVIAENV